MVKMVGQTASKIAKQAASQKAKPERTGPSKFEQKRAQLEKQVERGSLPPEVNQISAEQKRILENNLRKRLEQGNGQDVLKVDLRDARAKLDGLSKQVTAVPKTPALDAVRNRLNTLEGQYQQTEKTMNSLSGLESPREMLQLQMQMYKMTQNIEIMMKFVEQGTSGFKNIMQTQV
jgi:hypothetical protein